MKSLKSKPALDDEYSAKVLNKEIKQTLISALKSSKRRMSY